MKRDRIMTEFANNRQFHTHTKHPTKVSFNIFFFLQISIDIDKKAKNREREKQELFFQCPWESTSLNQYCCGIWYVFHFHQTTIDILDPSRLIRHVVERIWMGHKRTRREKCLNVTKFRSIFDNIRYIMTNHRQCFLLPFSLLLSSSSFSRLFSSCSLWRTTEAASHENFSKRDSTFFSTLPQSSVWTKDEHGEQRQNIIHVRKKERRRTDM